jgi:TRAP-type mannitol/chloroaromatic compound transport system permease small subunit
VDRWIRTIDKVNEWVGKASGVVLIPMVLITSYEVVMRYIFSKPTIWAWDLNIQLFAAISMFGGGYTLLHNSHVRVDVLANMLDSKHRAFLDILSSFFFFLGILVLLLGGWQMGWTSWHSREAMPTIWAPPYYTMKMMVPVGAFLVLIQGISLLLKNILCMLDRAGRH